MKRILSTGLLLVAFYAVAGGLPACDNDEGEAVDAGGFFVDTSPARPDAFEAPDAMPPVDTSPAPDPPDAADTPDAG